MHPYNKILPSLIEKFPDFEDVRWLFLSDPNFQELCSDYITCTEKVVDLKTELQECSDKMKEYTQLEGELEREILKKLWDRNSQVPD